MIGHRKCGKTTFANKLAKSYPYKVLIVQPDDRETIWSEYPELGMDVDRVKIKTTIWNSELKGYLLNFSKGLIIFDDCRPYLKSRFDEKFWTELLIRTRHHERDCIFITHSLFDFPPSLMQYINGLYIFPFYEPEDRILPRFHDKDQFREVWSRVKSTRKPELLMIHD